MKTATVFWAVLLACAGVSTATEAEPFRKKVIACSWDLGVVTFDDILTNREAFANVPFDGARLYANGARDTAGHAVSMEWMNGPALPEHAFDTLLPALREVTAMRAFRHSFLGVSLSSHWRWPRLDFRDDAAWNRFFGNVRQLAALARDGGCRGLTLDPEDYNKRRQFFRTEKDPPYGELLPLARRRGRELAEAIYGTFPEATVFSFWLWSSRRGYLASGNGMIAKARQLDDLWLAFLDGVLDGISPQGRLVDGDEYSYNYSPFANNRFTHADAVNRNRACIAAVSPENRMKFRQHVLMGSAVYLDRFVNPQGNFYYAGPVSGSRLLNFDETLGSALSAADEYVWIWAEKHAWINWRRWAAKRPARVGFTQHRTWEDVLPGTYDAVLSLTDPQRFVRERVPVLRRSAVFPNLAKTDGETIRLGMKKSRKLPDVTTQRGERHVVVGRVSGKAGYVWTAPFGSSGRLWVLPDETTVVTGLFGHVVRALPPVTKHMFSLGTTASTNECSVFEDVGVYRLPHEDEYLERGDWTVDVVGLHVSFSLDGGETADEHEIRWGDGAPVSAKVTRDAAGRVTLESSCANPDHPDGAWTRRLSFKPTTGDEMECEFFETRASRPGKDVTEKGVARRQPAIAKETKKGK